VRRGRFAYGGTFRFKRLPTRRPAAPFDAILAVLDPQPLERPPANVAGLGFLRHEPLVAVLEHLLPRLEAVIGKPADGQEHTGRAVEHQGLGPKPRDRRGELGKACGQVFVVPADETHALGGLIGQDVVAIDLFLVDPTVVMDGPGEQRRAHRERWRASRPV